MVAKSVDSIRRTHRPPRDCSEIYKSGERSDGVYTVYPNPNSTECQGIEVYCDMTTDGGGWTVCVIILLCTNMFLKYKCVILNLTGVCCSVQCSVLPRDAVLALYMLCLCLSVCQKSESVTRFSAIVKVIVV